MQQISVSDQKVCCPLIAQTCKGEDLAAGDVCYQHAHRRVSPVSRRASRTHPQGTVSPVRSRSPPGKAPRRSAASPPPSRWGGPRVVGLEWSSPYRLKPTMMSDQAWMDLAALGGTMQKQGWRQGRVRFKVCAPNLAERKEGEKSMKRRNRIPLCGIADARMGFATVSSFDS